ncbi:MAG: DEAD/DEAH box helicase [Spirochaetaceae bacterium]|nr:DEAD/DEAH box helicase [Spirochaetaceae bacterium]
MLTAETAAGKSTVVPLALMEAFPGKILVTEPRRLAAVAVASRHAQLLGESVGMRAGYRLRYDTCVSPATKIHVMTDAILTRMIQADPALDGVSVIVLDEFHERSLHTDLSLAFLKEIMMLRDDLYLVVMSATMDAGRVAQYLGEGEAAPCFHVEGRRFPVEIGYRPAPVAAGRTLLSSGNDLPLVNWCAQVVLEELHGSPPSGRDGGSILVFLPGIGEIRRCQQLLEQAGAGELAHILLLHSSISLEEQRLVLEADCLQRDAASGGTSRPTSKRRVILSSSIAETSLTVPDVTLVIDCGLSRTSRFDSRTGMTRLVTEIESTFSAEQRTGRAGRLGPGRCIRLWSPAESRLASMPPEITRGDLVPVVLECARWGVQELGGLAWLDCPSAGGWAAARSLLQEMGCLEESGSITDLGRRVLELGVHPRIGCVASSGLSGAVELAARYGASDSAEQQRLQKDLYRRLAGSKSSAGQGGGVDGASHALLAGFPDRLAKFCGDGVYQFPSGRTASLFHRTAAAPSQQRLSGNAFPVWIVAVEVDAGATTGRIYRWEPLAAAAVENWLENHATTQVELDVEDATGKVVKYQVRRYGRLELERQRLVPDDSDVAAALCGQVRRRGFGSLPLSGESQLLLVRARLWETLRQPGPLDAGALPPGAVPPSQFSEENLLNKLEDWLVPFLGGQKKLSAEVVYQGLHWFCDGATLDRELPLSIILANGKRRKLTYETIAGRVTPVLEVVIQELFGCLETPRVAGIPVLLRLLSPARRPLQVTLDLAGFWQNTWPDICKEMKGRYPKHNWDYRLAEC